MDNKSINELMEKSNNEQQNKEKYSKKVKKKKGKKLIITLSILDLLAIICIFLLYGPISYFRNLWVTSAMSTMTHQYLAYVFFNQKQIDYIMSQNRVIEVEEDTKKEDIQIGENIPLSEEDKLILTKDSDNDIYKVIDVQGNGYKGHLLVVYDPSKLKLVQINDMRYGKLIETFVKENGALAGINAGGFSYTEYSGYSPLGAVIINGNIVNGDGATGWGGGIIGMTHDNILVLTKSSAKEAIDMGVKDAVSFGPFLIVNGVASEFVGNGGYGVAPRTAIGQRKDGILLLLVIDGRRPGHSIGIDMAELTNLMLKYGAYNASNLDGGGSSAMVIGDKTISIAGGYGYSGDRYMHNAWLVMP